jgi:lipoate-protein ligase A
MGEGRWEQRWRLLLTNPLPGAANMALDDVLAARARASGETVLRVYSWTRPTLSLGRNQTARGAYDVARAAAFGVDIVRRPTGGRALLHDHEVTYSVTAPLGTVGSLRSWHAAVNALLLSALRRLGVVAELADPVARTPAPASAPCFEAPARGEIVLRGRKLVGSALLHEDGAVLQHGSILIDDDQAMVGRLSTRPIGAPAPAATLHEALGRVPAVSEVAAALFAAAGAGERAVPLSMGELDHALLSAATARYLSDEWTWRR